jgi:hypothetical protein
MIIHQIYIHGVMAFESKDDAPIARNGYRPLSLPAALQGMKLEAWNSHARRARSRIQRRKNHPQLADLMRTYAAHIVSGKEPLQSLVAEVQDHM